MHTNTLGDDTVTVVSPTIRYHINNSLAKAAISGEGSITRYQIIEPVLTKDKQTALQSLKKIIRDAIKDPITHSRLLKNFTAEFTQITKSRYPEFDSQAISSLEYYINRDGRGLGPIQPLIDDPLVTQISIGGPDQIITAQHKDHGIVFTSLELSSSEISILSKKLCNRAVPPVKTIRIPSEFSLKSGIHITFLSASDNQSQPIIRIEKPNHEQNEAESNQINKTIDQYRLYHELIEIRVSRTHDGKYHYIGAFPLSASEKVALMSAKREDDKKSGLSSPGGRALRLSFNEFTSHLSNNYPGISEHKYRCLYVALSFTQDPVRWIRMLISDARISRFQCTHPGVAITIWHRVNLERITTCFRPTRSDLNRFADFLMRSSGQQIDHDENETHLRFKSGEKAILTRVMDDEGHYYRIDLCKHNNNSDSDIPQKQNKNNANHIDINQVNKGNFLPDARVEELVSTIFNREGLSNKPEPDSAPDIVEDTHTDEGRSFSDFISPIRSGLKSLISRGSKKKYDGDEPLIPDNLQAPSVLNIQTKEGTVAEEAYWLYQPHSYVIITRDENKERTYRIIEPELSPRERIILEETHETLRDVLVYDKPVSKGELFLEYKEVAKVVRTYDPKITDDRLSVLYYYLRRNLNGYGKIDPLMYDELLEDISCNGHNLPVYVHHRYYGSIPTSISFDAEDLNRFVLKLSQKADKQVSLTSPLLDASLPNGSRAQITYSDVVSTKGSSFTIRKFRSDPMTPATLLSFGTYSDELLAFIWLALENRQSMIVVGGTASGKTSAMNAFSFFIPHNSKIVSLEDTREIQIPQKNWLPVQTRTSSSFNDRGNVDLFDLLKASLRQRPEYIIVGEVRGNEAQTLFQAMNSGHTTISTLHAGNIEEALNRLTNEPINVPPAMFGALNLMVIQTFHYREGRMIRRCDAIHEILLGEGDKVKWNTLFEYVPEDDSFRKVYTKSKTLQTIQYMHNWSDDVIQYQLDLRTAFLKRLKHQYSTNPEILIQMIADLRRRA